MKKVKTKFLAVVVVLVLGSFGIAEDIHWTDLGADHLWSTPENWENNTVPTSEDAAVIDPPAASAPNGPVIQEGIDAQIDLLYCEAAGETSMTITGGTLEIAGWGIWWGDGEGCHGTFYMSGGTIDLTGGPGIHEFGWGGGEGTWIMTGGTVNAKGVQLPTDSATGGQLYLYGGTYNVGTARGGLKMESTGLIDITEGIMTLEGDETEKVEGFIASDQIIAYSGAGRIFYDYNITNCDKTTVTARLRNPTNDPDAAGFPEPDHSETGVDPNVTLIWDPGANATSRDIYFGTDPDSLSLLAQDIQDPCANPSAILGTLLDSCTTYYWRVVEKSPGFDTPGPIWSFSTRPMSGIAGDFVCPDGVNLLDLAFWLDYWLEECFDCGQRAYDCSRADMDHSGAVNLGDFPYFSDAWYQGME